MSVKHKYIVSSFINAPFSLLEDAKWSVKMSFTRQEAKKYLSGQHIAHFIGEKLYSVTPIKVDEHGNISFGMTRIVKY